MSHEHNPYLPRADNYALTKAIQSNKVHDGNNHQPVSPPTIKTLNLLWWAILGLTVPLVTAIPQFQEASIIIDPDMPGYVAIWLVALSPPVFVPPFILFVFYGLFYRKTVRALYTHQGIAAPRLSWLILVLFPIAAGVANSFEIIDLPIGGLNNPVQVMLWRGVLRATLPLTVAILGLLHHQKKHRKAVEKAAHHNSLPVDTSNNHQDRTLILGGLILSSIIPLTWLSHTIISEKYNQLQFGIGILFGDYVFGPFLDTIVYAACLLTILTSGYLLWKLIAAFRQRLHRKTERRQ